MKLYIDKDFLDNFFICYSEKNIYHSDIVKFFKKIKGFNLVINFKDFEEFEICCIENPLLEYLINETVPEITFNPDLKSQILDMDFYEKDKYPFKLFFIEKSEEENEKLIYDFGYEYISTQNMEDRWANYLSDREDFKLKVTKDKEYPEELKFDSYEKIKKYKHPINAILFFDLYMLSNTKNQQIDDNFIQLLKSLVDFIPNKTSIDIQIVTEKFHLEIKKLKGQLEKKIGEFIPIEKFNLSIIRHSKKHYPKNLQGLKPRRIYTNYFTFASDDRFTYFKPNGGVNKLSTFWADFNFNYVNWLSTSKDLKEINLYKSKLPFYDQEGVLYSDKKEHAFDEI